MGYKRIIYFLGNQWRYRIDITDKHIEKIEKSMTPEQQKNTYLNVKLIH
ncbi:polymorphic toxin type 15 domain-containing protein [Bacillus cereus group sp. RP37]|nr:polymorphic toxin type 15 domain-containing protein [Bacillus wiedmannii]MDA1602981.1 polymorphic toxin type 15 domain-containing protein [Bacillus cereus]RFB15615.1 hypothetical protein DZB88_00900 [Bacillus sp. OE]RFB68472.1 hypothetical protein DZB94_27715 [Bacillus sp. AW]EKS7850036.1 hypothetical protein [Bacillus wiedmannii]HDX9671649.1 hypothetical protein [Bacillus cereus]